ncbi:MAG: hypothetical protein ACXQTD_08220 [Candidatus Syntropharchaeia archaeon]
MKLVRKCPVCNADSLLQDSKPVFSEGCYQRIYRCERGHVWRVKIYFRGIKRTVTEVLKGDADESGENGE